MELKKFLELEGLDFQEKNDAIVVDSDLELWNPEIKELPTLRVNGNLTISGSGITTLPRDLFVNYLLDARDSLVKEIQAGDIGCVLINSHQKLKIRKNQLLRIQLSNSFLKTEIEKAGISINNVFKDIKDWQDLIDLRKEYYKENSENQPEAYKLVANEFEAAKEVYQLYFSEE